MNRRWWITTAISVAALLFAGMGVGIDHWAPWVWAKDIRPIAESAYDETYRKLLLVQQQKRLKFRGVEPNTEAERQRFLSQEEQRLKNRLEQLKRTKERYR